MSIPVSSLIRYGTFIQKLLQIVHWILHLTKKTFYGGFKVTWQQEVPDVTLPEVPMVTARPICRDGLWPRIWTGPYLKEEQKNVSRVKGNETFHAG